MAGLDALPAELAELLDGSDLVPVTVGQSGASMARVVRAGGDWFVKIAAMSGPLASSLADEARRLDWLMAHVSVPAVVTFGSNGVDEWLVTESMAGSDLTSAAHQGDAQRLLRLFAQGLSRFHATVPADVCPFDARTDTLVQLATDRVEAGLVDASRFAGVYQGASAADLLASAIGLRPERDPDDLVVLHGDYCVPNVLADHSGVTGYVDVARVGVGDRYLDLADASRSVVRNLGGHAVGPFFDAYGIDHPDVRRLEFFTMLTELL